MNLLDDDDDDDVVGQVDTNSLVLFFIGNEKSFRGQQLTSIRNVYCEGEEEKTNVMYVCLWRRIFLMND